MEKNEIILSLCVPTCNRGRMLDYVLHYYLSCTEFDNQVELVISDNASIDNTQQIVADFIEKHPNKNIKYYRNERNIGTLNFLEAISHARGKYAKLCNDYLYIDNIGLKYMKDMIKNTNAEIALFFYDSLRDISLDYISVNNVDAFIKLVNNKMTWVSNFGCWRKDIPLLAEYTNDEPKVNSYIIQTAFWALYLVDHYKESHVVDFRNNHCLSVPNSKRALKYNFFTPHVVYYYDMIHDYAIEGKVSQATILFDKKRLLSDFVGYKIVEYLILHKDCPFDLKGSWKLIFKYFGGIPYFYYIIPKLTFIRGVCYPMKEKAKKVLRILGLFEQCKKMWNKR